LGNAEPRADFVLRSDESRETEFDEQFGTKDYGETAVRNESDATEQNPIPSRAMICEDNPYSMVGSAGPQRMMQADPDSNGAWKESDSNASVEINTEQPRKSQPSLGPDRYRSDSDTTNTRQKRPETTISIAVGVSKLYMVKLPALQMFPIYWSPINYAAAVTRGTWFYGDTMYPVEPEIATQLDPGYNEGRP
jgi:hypothetical protein